ncbi:transposase [Micromonospora sp. NPDC005171]|uniref:IS110 family transposase n=1 Tax=Micromonospora sp. NPDC005171 TaxID=3156866 RepID=UPI0033A774C9
MLDVPAKLSARVRVFDTGQGRKTDPVDAHSIAVAGLRSPHLRRVTADDATVVIRLLVDRRDELGRARTHIVSRIHHLLLELIPGGAKKFLTRGQASCAPPRHRPASSPRPAMIWPVNSSKSSPSSTPRCDQPTSSSANSSPTTAAP